MQRDLRLYLADILEQCDDICSFTHQLTFEQYLYLREKRRAVERAFIILGEALVCATRLTEDLHERLPDARRVIAFRNILVHNYSVIDEQQVWQIVKEHVPALRVEAEQWFTGLRKSGDD